MVDSEQLKINYVQCCFVNSGFGGPRMLRQAAKAITIVVNLLTDWALGSDYSNSLSEENRWQHIAFAIPGDYVSKQTAKEDRAG
jgi:hypothetical protein